MNIVLHTDIYYYIYTCTVHVILLTSLHVTGNLTGCEVAIRAAGPDGFDGQSLGGMFRLRTRT